MKNSRGGASKSTSKAGTASPGLASNGKPFRIRLLKCAIDHNIVPTRKMAATRPSPARGASLDPAAGKPA